MFITIQVTQEEADRLRKGKGHPPSRLDRALEDLQIDLRPIHPGTNDPDLSTFYFASVAQPQFEQLRKRLLAIPTVIAVFDKPEDSLPSSSQH